jgi:hypothetical protein
MFNDHVSHIMAAVDMNPITALASVDVATIFFSAVSKKLALYL